MADLVEHGYENVAVVEDAGRIIITYENRIYRYETAALYEVLRRAEIHAGSTRQIILLLRRRNVAIVAFTACAKADDEQAFDGIQVSTDVAAYEHLLGSSARANASHFKLDLVIHPQFMVQLGNYDEPVESQVNIAPELTLSPWQGMRVSAQVILPLQNELGAAGDYVRPGLVTLSQMARLPHSIFLMGSAGYFTKDRYGLDVQAKKFFAGGRWSAGAQVGYTGHASFHRGDLLYSHPQDVSWSVNLEAFLPRYTLFVRSTTGRFVFGDVGTRVDVMREFGEFRFGFLGVATDEGENAGFTLSVPLPFGRYARPAPVRVRPARAFPWEYRSRGYPSHGVQYRTGNAIDDVWHGITPAFLMQNVMLQHASHSN